MKKKNQILALGILSTLLSSQAFSAVLDSGSCGGNCKWEITDDGKLTFTGTGENGAGQIASTSWRSSSYRDTISEINVSNGITNAPANVFKDLTNITKVTIPDSVTTALGS